jgi:hypothetical protein
MYLFVALLAVGVVFDFLAYITLFGVLQGKPFAFAIFFTLGNLLTIAST